MFSFPDGYSINTETDEPQPQPQPQPQPAPRHALCAMLNLNLLRAMLNLRPTQEKN